MRTNADSAYGRRYGFGGISTFRRRMVETGQRADGQLKVLRLTSDRSFAAELEADRDLVGERASA